MPRGSEIADLRFLSFQSGKHTYVRAYKNRWVPKTVLEDGTVKEGHSAPRIQMHVGAIGPDGLVRVSKAFLEKFPQFQGYDWHFLDHELLDEDTYYEEIRTRPAPENAKPTGTANQGPATPQSFERETDEFVLGDEPKMPEQLGETCDDDATKPPERNSKSFMATFALKTLAQKTGIVDALIQTFGSRRAEAWMGMVVYQNLSGNSADCYENWACGQYLHPVAASLDGRKISRLYQTCSREEWDRFWLERFRQSETRNDDKSHKVRFCAFDSTSIGTYADLDVAAYTGHAKQDPDLEQVNLACVYDQVSGEIVYAFLYEGSIDDKQTYTYIFDRMKDAGFPMESIMLVTDRGYPSNAAINYLLNEGGNFLTKCRVNARSEDEKFLVEKFHDITGKIQSRDRVHGVKSTTRTETWRLNDNRTVKVYVHYYLDPEAAEQKNSSLEQRILTIHERLLKGETIDADEWATMKRFFVKAHGDGRGDAKGRWALNQAEIERREAKAGVSVIRTNAISDASQAYEIYRLREHVELGFSILKHEVQGRRLKVTQTSLWGKALVYMLSTSLHVKALRRFDAYCAAHPESNLRLSGDSLKKTLLELDNYVAERARPGAVWRVAMMPKRLRDLAQVLFGVTEIPRRLRA